MIRLSPKPCSSPSRALDAERYFVAGGNDRIMVSLLEVFERADVLRAAFLGPPARFSLRRERFAAFRLAMVSLSLP